MKPQLRYLIACALFAALSAVSAFIRIPTPMVPITLQTMVVAAAGMLLGAKYGAISQALYVAIGLLGVPVFTQGGGFSYVLQPTFGYLLGFIGGAFISGIISRRGRPGWRRTLAASFASLAVVYAVGVPYLYLVTTQVLGLQKTVGWVLQIGFLASIPSDVITSVLLCLFIPRLTRALQSANVLISG